MWDWDSEDDDRLPDAKDRGDRIERAWKKCEHKNPDSSYIDAVKAHSRYDGKLGFPQRLVLDAAISHRMKRSPLRDLLPGHPFRASIEARDRRWVRLYHKPLRLQVTWYPASEDDASFDCNALHDRLQDSLRSITDPDLRSHLRVGVVGEDGDNYGYGRPAIAIEGRSMEELRQRANRFMTAMDEHHPAEASPEDYLLRREDIGVNCPSR